MLALLLATALACAGGQATDSQATPYPTYTLYPTYTPVSATNAQPAYQQVTPIAVPSGRPTLPGSSATVPGQSTPQPTDDPDLRDITEQQHRQLDQQIADLQASPQILAECAEEAGDPVPAPGSEGEAEWYGQAAIRYGDGKTLAKLPVADRRAAS